MRLRLCLLVVLGLLPTMASANTPPPPAASRNCQNSGTFEAWLEKFRAEAAKAGISRPTLTSALDGMTLDPSIISRDRRQSFFSQTFAEVASKLATKGRQQSGIAAIKKHQTHFAKAAEKYGVPAAPIAAFWALESDFGSGMGNLPVLRSLATLAYDCRRGEMFRGELLAALRIIDRGDLKPAEMIGSWAGELGQTQFLPTHYWNHAVDGDGDGKRDLMRSPADIIASTAAFMASLGWRRGEPWLEEVSVPAELRWEQADLAIQHPRSQWAKWGVKKVGGTALAADAMPASLHLPMGRNGPAFLAYQNFQVYLQWNQALTYATTAAYLANRIDGAPPVSAGRAAVAPFGHQEIRDLQQILKSRGFYAGEIDGKLGAGSRAAVRAAQLKLGFPADAYPTPELLERLKAR
ncbi:MAG: lytic murein transglycosylase [Hyphomicrobiaceae bacterium]